MKISSPSEKLKPSEVAPRSSEASSSRAARFDAELPATKPAEASPPPEAAPANTTLSTMVKTSAAMDEADHAARLMGVAMALQSGRYSVDIMRIATALMRQ